MYRSGRRWRRSFGWPIPMAIEVNGCGADEFGRARGSRGGGGGFFGPDGFFGPQGPFGPDGPFGPTGPFGPKGPFGAGDGEAWNRRARGGMRGQRRGRMFGQGELRLALLKLIADEPRHGYGIMQLASQLSGGRVRLAGKALSWPKKSDESWWMVAMKR